MNALFQQIETWYKKPFGSVMETEKVEYFLQHYRQPKHNLSQQSQDIHIAKNVWSSIIKKKYVIEVTHAN